MNQERSKSMKQFLMLIVLSAVLLFISIADLPRLGFVKNAEAIIGMPWTPMSYAGVARRTMYREAAYGAAASAAAANVAAANYAAANAAAAQASAAHAAAAQAAAAQASAAAAAAHTAAAGVPVETIVPNLPPGCQ